MNEISNRDVRIVVSNRLHVTGLPCAVERVIRGNLTLANPGFVTRQRLGFWLDETPETLTLAERSGDALILPRGYLETLLKRVREADCVPVISDQRLKLPPIDLFFRGELRPYQASALGFITKNASGVLVAPCGSGKTVLSCSLIAHWRQPALILCHAKDLMRQWRGELRKFLGVDAGQIGDGAFDVQPVTVALVQALTARPDLAEDIKNRFGLVLLDECHHAPARTFTEVIQEFPAALRYGLSATPDRQDGLTPFLFAVIGPQRHAITTRDLHAGGVLVTPRVEMVPTEFTSHAPDWVGLMNLLVRDIERNTLAATIIISLLDAGRQIIALSERVAHVEHLAHLVDGLRPGAAVVAHGKLSKAARVAALEKMSSGKARILFATKLADEGLDLPNLDALVLLTPSRDAGRTTQRAGRILRAVPGKPPPVVVDLVDAKVSLLASQARTRFFEVYRHIAPRTQLPAWLERKRSIA